MEEHKPVPLTHCVAAVLTFVTLGSAGRSVAQSPAPTWRFVSASDVEPGGPAHDFRIGVFEVRNDQFVDFLNDALAHPGDERGQFLFFDIDTGEVFLHSATTGAQGTSGSGTLIFSPAGNPFIAYNATPELYEVAPGFESHPVTGVSWYGAAKYCNWLTIDIGLDPNERIYQEAPGTNLAGWHPVTISDADWLVRDLSTAERDALLSKRGFRLPMDGGVGSGNPGLYNEWYKAAAWDGTAHTLYGFGRDSIQGADANYRCSTDPFEDPFDCIVGGTTPVGYFDGVNLLGDAITPTIDTGNRYGLYDLSGNVWEWMQDQGLTPTDRHNRGGSFRSGVASLETVRIVERNAEAVDDATGFRLVQSAVEALLVTPSAGLVTRGTWGGPYDPNQPTSITYTVTNVTDSPIPFVVSVDAFWLSVTVNPPGAVDPLAGTLSPGSAASVTIQLAPACDGSLSSGSRSASLEILDANDGTIQQRTVQIAVTEPLDVTSAGTGQVAMVIGDTDPVLDYVVENRSDSPVDFFVRWQDTTNPPVGTPWITLNGAASISPTTLATQQTASVAVAFVTTGLVPGTYTADVIVEDECTGTMFTRPVTLQINPRFSVTPASVPDADGGCVGPFVPSEHIFTLTNLVPTSSPWQVVLQPVAPETAIDWLDITPSSGTLAATNGTIDVTVAINAQANAKPNGDYSIKVQFSSAPGQPAQAERIVTIHVGDLVTPETGARLEGPIGGAFVPASATYTILNTVVLGGLEWSAQFAEVPSPGGQPSGIVWWQLSVTAGTIVNPQGTADVVFTLAQAAQTLPAGTYVGNLTITLDDPSGAAGCVFVRSITLVVGTPAVALDMVRIPAEDVQPFGPTYLYRISRFEITNEEFVRFLNDARANPSNGQGRFLQFDLATGVVTLSGDATAIFDPAAGGMIHFDPQRNGGEYVVNTGKERFPVTGVSWYGALKFCNWMTLRQGMDNPDQRVYAEGPTASDWRPFAVDPNAYPGRDLLSAERADLVANDRGFRLAMDDESGPASMYNEWYKAAAWNNATTTNATFGFGRDVLTLTDANYKDSADPFEVGPAPVGFFGVDGDRTWNDALFGWGFQPPTSFAVADTDNGYGLYDMTGNVAEWVQDLGLDSNERAIRGGHFESLLSSVFLQADARSSRPADATTAQVGFRVVQTIVPADLIVSVDVTIGVRSEGVVGGPFTPTGFLLSVQNAGVQTLDDFSVSPDVPWLTVDSPPPQQLKPSETATISLSIDPDPLLLGVASAPAGGFVLVPASDVQAGPSGSGPDYDYWISRTELTNTQFAQFLNDSRSNAVSLTPDARSEHLYFDLDSSNVYIHDQVAGEEGTIAPAGNINTLIYDASAGRIQLVNDTYTVEVGFENHPVVGVSWYGAVKYCNWLSIRNGMAPSLLAYTEAPSPQLAQWRPVVADDLSWVPGGMTATLRQQFVTQTLGYRLPMDDEATTAAPYNEWYKAASFKGLDSGGAVQFDALYGFGRDPLTDLDANFFDSRDTALDGTTTVRFFDGINTLFANVSSCLAVPPSPTRTADTDNGYGLYDMTGNVAEWVQDFGLDVTQRTTRGGSWKDDIKSALLQTAVRASLPASDTQDFVGFRVVRGVGSVAMVTIHDSVFDKSQSTAFVVQAREPFEITPTATTTTTEDLYGATFSGSTASYVLTNLSASMMAWRIQVDQPWLEIDIASTGLPPAVDLFGTIGPGMLPDVQVTTTTAADALVPGTYQAHVTFANETTGHTDSRMILLIVDQPIAFTPDDLTMQQYTGLPGGPFVNAGATTSSSFSLKNLTSLTLDYDITVDQPWLNVQPFTQLSGSLAPAPASRSFVIGLTSAADTLLVGEHEAKVKVAWVDPNRTSVTDMVEQTVKLVVHDWIDVLRQGASVPQQPWTIAGLNPNNLPADSYTLTNRGSVPFEVSVCVEEDWVDVDANLVDLPARATSVVNVSLNDNALALMDGTHTATVVFEDVATADQQSRTIELKVDEEFFVTPVADFATGGSAGGLIQPAGTVYTLHNASALGDLDWTASIQFDPGDPNWLLINGQPSASGTLADGASTNLVISVDPAATAAMSSGSHTAIVTVSDVPTSRSLSRTVTLSLVVPQVRPVESVVAAVPIQPGGPTYSYMMSSLPTTNADFVSFLNDAHANPANERGQYLFFDTTTGDVYMNFLQTGEDGPDPGSRTILMFSPAVSGQIEYDSTADLYRVMPATVDYSFHPVAGVTWYGAVKYCNWLTLDQGMLPGQRCYQEGSAFTPDAWHPVTISDSVWLFRDLNDAERFDLVTNFRGYRLPMDDGAANMDVSTDNADAYNEWYKAAAWDSGLRRNHLYGFGRDVLPGSAPDANYRCSGDPFEDPLDCALGSTTPVGYYGGPHADPSFPTASNNNPYAIFDMTGNVHEWMQGRFGASSGSIGFRTLRGGSWADWNTSDNLKTLSRSFASTATADDRVGFRIVRTPPGATADINLDGVVDLNDFALMAKAFSGPGGIVTATSTAYDVDLDGDVDLADFAAFQLLYTAGP